MAKLPDHRPPETGLLRTSGSRKVVKGGVLRGRVWGMQRLVGCDPSWKPWRGADFRSSKVAPHFVAPCCREPVVRLGAGALDSPFRAACNLRGSAF